MTIKRIFFDLDGTLTDSSEGIFNSVRYAIKKFDYPEPSLTELRGYVGPPLLASFMENYQLTEAQGQEMVQAYREYYTDQGMEELFVYQGIPEVLAQLTENYLLSVATSKPEIFAKQIIQTTGLPKYFSGIFGADLESQRVAKADVIRYGLAELGQTNPKEVIMVGDRSHDILGANENNMSAVGVLYGFGDQKELSGAGAKWLAEKPADLIEIFQKFS
ncbi:HAD hydrolase-like protein [Enterococcus sp. LJL120]